MPSRRTRNFFWRSSTRLRGESPSGAGRPPRLRTSRPTWWCWRRTRTYTTARRARRRRRRRARRSKPRPKLLPFLARKRRRSARWRRRRRARRRARRRSSQPRRFGGVGAARRGRRRRRLGAVRRDGGEQGGRVSRVSFRETELRAFEPRSVRGGNRGGARRARRLATRKRPRGFALRGVVRETVGGAHGARGAFSARARDARARGAVDTVWVGPSTSWERDAPF